MNFIVWIIFGGLAGWVATMLTGDDPRFGIIGNIIIGIVGAYLGGWLSGKLFGGPSVSGFDIKSFIVAVIGAVVLLFIINLVS
jgi:uncharacterized membrane protein YeaQ/YmgE (transglycosylase-associated protein family)